MVIVKMVDYWRPKLYKKQEEAFFNNKRYSFIEASTKAGKTYGGIAWIVEKSLLDKRSNRHRWWIAPVYQQAKIAYERMKNGLPKEILKCNDTELTIRLVDNYIDFKSGEKPDNLFGEDVDDALIDEGSRLRKEAYHAVRTTLTHTEGQLRVIGNVKGRKNWFYQTCRKAESGHPDMYYSKITAYDAIKANVLKQEEIEDAKEQLPENVFKELYLAEASDDEGNPFGIENIRLCMRDCGRNDTSAASVFGVDLAKSMDWTVIIGLTEQGQVCYFDRFQLDWNNTRERIKSVVGKTKAYIDSTGVGDPILEDLQKEGPNYEGYKFTQPSKQQLMEGLVVAIQKQQLSIPEGPIISELESFEYEYTRTGVKYSAPQGLHDDCVCALALANHGLIHKPIIGDFIPRESRMYQKKKKDKLW